MNQIQNIISTTIDPHTDKPFGESAIKSLSLKDNILSSTIEVPYPCKQRQQALTEAIRQSLHLQYPCVDVSRINWHSKIAARQVQKGVPMISNVRNIIAIASGKGGVGKSTTAVNLALAMAQEGANVGILDADIYGPSVPQMLGIADQKPEAHESRAILPIQGHGIQAISIGLMIDRETPAIWRGPMVSQALMQLIQNTLWHNLDFLFIDMPPGTGDIQLTLSQKVPLTGAIIVTTPQDIALLDARKGLKMFEKVGVSILGIIENMSLYCCPQCGHQAAIFGKGGATQMSTDYQTPLLGQIPLALSIREETDAGIPTVVSQPNTSEAKTYHDMAHRIAIGLLDKPRSFNSKIPNIVLQKD